jgi:hypothetical protein
MARKTEPPKPIAWGIYNIAGKAVWLGNVEATDKPASILSQCWFRVTALA